MFFLHTGLYAPKCGSRSGTEIVIKRREAPEKQGTGKPDCPINYAQENAVAAF
jgi:hypothetical protein